MSVRITKSAVNIREKLAELERPIGVNGSALLRTETPQEAFSLIGAGRRNLIINSEMKIDQRNNGSAIASLPATSSTFVVDRWAVYAHVGGVFTAGRNLNSISPPANFSNYFGIQNTAQNTTGVYVLQQGIEGLNFASLDFGKSTAKNVTLSFWMYSSVAGTFGGTLMNYAQTRIYPFAWSYSNKNSWQYVTITIPGDTTGTWIGATTGGACSVIFCLGGDPNYWNQPNNKWFTSGGGGTYGGSGQVNLANISGSTFYITGVQLEEGKIATPFQYRSIGEELSLCQRYYQALIPSGAGGPEIAMGTFYNTTDFRAAVHLKQTMRAVPVLVQTTGTNYYAVYYNGTNTQVSSLTLDGSSTINYVELNVPTAAGAIGAGGLLRANNGSAYVAVSAEL